MTLGLLLTALSLGFRHGVDWDHLAAIADLSTSAQSRRHGFVLSFVYAAGHAVVVFALGLLAILFGSHLPEGLDSWMGRTVGITLIVMGVWTLYDLAVRRRAFRLRSRWMLVLDGTFAGLRRVREAARRRNVVVEHEHPHDHGDVEPEEGNGGGPGLAHDHAQAHDHAHRSWPSLRRQRVLAGPPGPAAPEDIAHTHAHQHHLHLVEDPTAQVGNGTAAAVGLLHGIGFESPTQIAIFVASTAVAGPWAGVLLLAAWVVGLLAANTVIAVLAGRGLLQAERNFAVYATVAVVVGIISMATGVLFVAGFDVLPTIWA